jgi:hypothetical protein
VLRVDGDRLDTSQPFSGSRLALVSSDSKVRLFFDGLETRAWRRPSPLALSGKGRSVLQVAVESFPRRSAVFHPNVGISVDREIEKVRSRRKSVRRMSVMGKRPRRTSYYRARDDAEEASNQAYHEEMRTHATAELDRIEAAIDAATADAVRVVAAHANAQLSFELMERKAHENDAHSNGAFENDADSQPSWTESAETDDPLATAGDELETLRAENAQQKALIQQLLLENRQLRTQQQQQQHSQWFHGPDADLPIAKRKRSSDSRLPQQQERDRGPSSVSTDSSLSSLSRRNSFAVDAVDETPVDHAFDLLVAEITLELDELLSEGKWPPVRRRTRVSVDSSTVEAIGGLVRCV